MIFKCIVFAEDHSKYKQNIGRFELLKYKKIINSTMLPCLHFGMNRQCFDAVRLTWPAYVDGRKRENNSV